MPSAVEQYPKQRFRSSAVRHQNGDRILCWAADPYGNGIGLQGSTRASAGQWLPRQTGLGAADTLASLRRIHALRISSSIHISAAQPSARYHASTPMAAVPNSQLPAGV